MQIAQFEDFLQFVPLKAVFTSTSTGFLLDAKAIVWANFEIENEQIKFFSIQNQAFSAIESLNKLIQLAVNFEKQSERFLPDLRYQFVQQQLTIEQELRTNTAFKQQVQVLLHILEELGKTSKELPILLNTLNYWSVLFANTSIKKSFFRRYELLYHFKKLAQRAKSIFLVEKYEQFRDFILNFCKQNNIKDTHLILYGVFASFVQDYSIKASKRFFVPYWNQVLLETNPVHVLIYDAGFLKLIENQEFDKNTLFTVATTIEELMCMHSTVQLTEQATLLTDSTSIQTGIFGVSQMALLSQKIQETAFDLIFLDVSTTSFTRKGKTPLLFQSLKKEDKQILYTIQMALNQLSENGKLCVFLPSTEWLTEKKYSSLRRLLEQWASQIQVLENKLEKTAILILHKNSAQKAVFYLELNKSLTSFHFSASLEDWQPKIKPSPFFKLLAAHSTNETKGLFNKTYSLPTLNHFKNYIDANQKYLIVKVKNVFQKHNQKQISKQRQSISKTAHESSLGSLFEEESFPIMPERSEKIALEVKQKNIVESRISLVENGFWYYEPSIFDEFYPLDKLFPNREKGENMVLLWASGHIWLIDQPVFPLFVQQLLPEAHVFPLFVFEKGKKRYNFSPALLHTFRKVYIQSYEKRLQKLEEQVQRLFNVADFEFLQLSTELSLSLQAWTAWLETPTASVLYTHFDTQKNDTTTAFEQGKRLFIEAKRMFEYLGMKGVRNKESHQMLSAYFQNTFFEDLNVYWEQVEQEKLENFTVPTMENMTEEAIFDYIIAVWNDESFKHKYHKELTTNLPRIPFYKDFHGYVQQGNSIKKIFLEAKKADIQVIEIASDTDKPTKKYWQADAEDTTKVWFDATTLLENVPNFFTQIQIRGVSLLEYILKELRKQKKSLKEGIEILSNPI